MKEDELKQLLLCAEDMMSQCHEDNVAELKSRFHRLSTLLLDVRAKADKLKVFITHSIMQLENEFSSATLINLRSGRPDLRQQLSPRFSSPSLSCSRAIRTWWSLLSTLQKPLIRFAILRSYINWHP